MRLPNLSLCDHKRVIPHIRSDSVKTDMENDYLNHKLECKSCGTIYMDIPRDAREDTTIHCSTCHGYLGRWGELQNDLYRQIVDSHGAFELKDGRIREK